MLFIDIKKIPDQIITEPLVPLDVSKVDAVALHHMACEGDVKAIEAAHIKQGWRAIGYNYWIDYDGTVYEGRGLHVGAGVELIAWLKAKLPRDVKICGHKAFGGTVCPGRYFPLEELETLQKRGEEQQMIYNYIDGNMPAWARATVQKLADKGYLKGDGNGLGLTDDMLKIFTILDRAGVFD